MQRFQTLRDSAYGVTYGTNYLQQGRYAEASVSTGAEAGLVDARTPQVVFADATLDAFCRTAGGEIECRPRPGKATLERGLPLEPAPHLVIPADTVPIAVPEGEIG